MRHTGEYVSMFLYITLSIARSHSLYLYPSLRLQYQHVTIMRMTKRQTGSHINLHRAHKEESQRSRKLGMSVYMYITKMNLRLIKQKPVCVCLSSTYSKTDENTEQHSWATLLPKVNKWHNALQHGVRNGFVSGPNYHWLWKWLWNDCLNTLYTIPVAPKLAWCENNMTRDRDKQRNWFYLFTYLIPAFKTLMQNTDLPLQHCHLVQHIHVCCQSTISLYNTIIL